jgi:hypothetical protein
MTELEEAADLLAKTFWRLSSYGYIQTFNEEEEGRCKHWERIGLQAMEDIKRLVPPEPSNDPPPKNHP